MLALFVALGFLFAALFGVGITGIFVVGARYDEEDLFSEQDDERGLNTVCREVCWPAL